MPVEVPTLTTPRLLLRAWRMTDLAEFQRIGNDLASIQALTRMPYPFTLEDAEKYLRDRFIGQVVEGSDRTYTFAITLAANGQVVGACGLRIQDAHNRAELGYWLAREAWRNGYTTEACREVLRFGFEDLKLRRIHADYYRGNTASARVLEKLRFAPEGCQRGHTVRFGKAEDLMLTGMLSEEWARAADGKKY